MKILETHAFFSQHTLSMNFWGPPHMHCMNEQMRKKMNVPEVPGNWVKNKEDTNKDEERKNSGDINQN